jgi:hypothetical protein
MPKPRRVLPVNERERPFGHDIHLEKGPPARTRRHHRLLRRNEPSAARAAIGFDRERRRKCAPDASRLWDRHAVASYNSAPIDEFGPRRHVVPTVVLAHRLVELHRVDLQCKRPRSEDVRARTHFART